MTGFLLLGAGVAACIGIACLMRMHDRDCLCERCRCRDARKVTRLDRKLGPPPVGEASAEEAGVLAGIILASHMRDQREGKP